MMGSGHSEGAKSARGAIEWIEHYILLLNVGGLDYKEEPVRTFVPINRSYALVRLSDWKIVNLI